GANSLLRNALADRFCPSLDMHRNKYMWCATKAPFDSFTFIFEETPEGLFQAHVYPHAQQACTFIVETSPETWSRSGLEHNLTATAAPGDSDLESIAFCERVFARHLHEYPLLANNSKWLSFPTVRNQSWHSGNVVLLGDAAHTAHFSIGS